MSDFSPGPASMRAAGLQVTRAPYVGSGSQQIRMSLEAMAQKMREGRLDSGIRGWALDCLKQHGLDGRDSRTTPYRQAAALLDCFRSATVYAPDPYGAELVPGASATLCLRPNLCLQGDDCDGLTVAYGSLCMSIGLPVQIVKQSYGGDAQEHVLCAVYDGSEWQYADPSTNLPFGSAVDASNEQWFDPMGAIGPLQEAQPEIVTFGKPGTQRRRRVNPVPHWLGFGGATATVPVAGDVWPGDVLAYRAAWNDFVMGTAQAMATCATAWTAASNGTTPSTPPNLSQFAVAPDKTTIGIWAKSEQQFSDDLISSWNAHANSTDAEIVILAADILRDFQNTVQRAGTFYQPQVKRDCPGIVLPQPPSLDLQREIISQIEGAGILARGVLQLFQIGADGFIAPYRAVGDFFSNPPGGKATFAFGGLLTGIGLTLGGLIVLDHLLPRR